MGLLRWWQRGASMSYWSSGSCQQLLSGKTSPGMSRYSQESWGDSGCPCGTLGVDSVWGEVSRTTGRMDMAWEPRPVGRSWQAQEQFLYGPENRVWLPPLAMLGLFSAHRPWAWLGMLIQAPHMWPFWAAIWNLLWAPRFAGGLPEPRTGSRTKAPLR